MDIKQAAERWEVSEATAKNICANMQIDTNNIPDDLVPVLKFDYLSDDPHSLYLIILGVIANTHLDLEGIDQSTLETCLEELREKELIVAKNSRPEDSNDYHDYIISANREEFYNWNGCKTASDLSLFKKVISVLTRMLHL